MAHYAVGMRDRREEERKEAAEAFTLQELAEATGIEQRTIRSYVERGILPGPESLGRGARYPREALDRLRVLQLLRDANPALTLDQVRVLLRGLSLRQLRDIASGALRIGAVIDTDAPPLPGKGDALSYLRSIQSAAPPPADAGPTLSATHAALFSGTRAESVDIAMSASALPMPTDTEHLSALAHAARALLDLTGVAPSVRGVRGEAWYRIPITPDIELSVRGAYGTEEMAQLHRIGEALRHLLTKGAAR